MRRRPETRYGLSTLLLIAIGAIGAVMIFVNVLINRNIRHASPLTQQQRAMPSARPNATSVNAATGSVTIKHVNAMPEENSDNKKGGVARKVIIPAREKSREVIYEPSPNDVILVQ